MRRGALFAVSAVLGLGAVGGCQCHDPTRLVGTAFFVHVDFDDGLGLTQLRFAGSVAGQAIFDTTLPSTAAGTLTSEQTVRIDLADRFDGQTVDVEVDGLQGNVARASGFASQQVVKGVEVDVYVTLGAGDAGTCGACAGCCSGKTCVTQTSLTICGSGGVACAPCNLTLADSCGANGCACGTGLACQAARGSDRCTSGSCVCGTGAACAPGLECDGGGCQCTPASCPGGCCDRNGQCVMPSFIACGVGGVACVRCNSFLSDSCLGGSCQCGGGAGCDAGAECLGSQCQCTAASCPGCCSGLGCQPGSTSVACGSGGSTCLACTTPAVCDNGTCGSSGSCPTCNSLTSDGCNDAGVCTCDGGLACDATAAQWCSGGVCTCHPAGCAAGCCEGAACRDGGFPYCGSQGAACSVCDPVRADSCLGGACACDGGPACTALLGSDNCTGGACQCGNMPPCASGSECVGGNCVCDPTSCKGCCRGGNCFAGTAKNSCGTGGTACAQCTGQHQCVDAGCQ